MIKGRDRVRPESARLRIAAKIAARRRKTDRHTPGDWGPQTVFDGNLTIGIDYPEGDERDHYLCEITCGDPEELRANANLIWASPRMLAACRAAEKLLDGVAFVSTEGDTDGVLRLLRDALSAAQTGAAS